MSIKLMTLAWELPLEPTEKLVLLKLCDWVNEESGKGYCWPSIAKLAELTHVSEATIKRCIRRLEAAGHIRREFVPGSTTRYHVIPQRIAGGVNLTRVTSDPPGRSPVTPNTEEIQKPSRAKALSGSRATGLPSGDNEHVFRVWCVQWAVSDMGWSAGDAGREYERFTDHAIAKGRTAKDWKAAWRGWCRNQFQKTKPAEESAHSPFRYCDGPAPKFVPGPEPQTPKLVR